MPAGPDTITTATPQDIPQLVDLLGVLFTQEADFRPDPVRQERALRLLIGSPGAGVVFVARGGPEGSVSDRGDGGGGEVLGTVSLLHTISTAEGGPAAWLEDMVVRPDQRGTGLGSRLLRHAIDHARKAGLVRIQLLADRDNAGALRFYGREGFTPASSVPLRLRL